MSSSKEDSAYTDCDREFVSISIIPITYMHLLFPDSVDQKFPVGHRFKYTCEKPGTHSGPSRINCALVLSNF